jgi:photosystem II stability/assembly factor-like uncharacterized protein
VGEGSTVLATRDGGSTWVTQHRAATGTLRDLHVSGDAMRGWAVGSGGAVLRTEDGGNR